MAANESCPGGKFDITMIKLPGGVTIPSFTVALEEPIKEVIENVVETYGLNEDEEIYNLYVTTGDGRVIRLERNYTVEDYVHKEEKLLTCYSSIDLSRLPPPTPNLELNVQLK